MQVFRAIIFVLLAVGCFPDTVLASLPIVEAPRPKGLHDGIVDALEIQVESDRSDAMEEILWSYLANESREVVHQTLVFLSINSRWIDLRQFDHLIPSISPSFAGESRLAAWIFDRNRLRREPLNHRLDIYRIALIDGKVELWNGSSFDRDDAAQHVASSGLMELMPLVEEYFSETRMAIQHGVTFSEFENDYALFLGATDADGARILAVNRLKDIEDQGFRERMTNEEGFRKRARRAFDYVCAQNPFSGAIEPACEHVLQIYIREQCFWLEALQTILEAGEKLPMAGPGGSHPVSWIGSLERYSFQGRTFEAHFYDARKEMEGCNSKP